MADFGLVLFEDDKAKTEINAKKTGNLAGKLFMRSIELLFDAKFFCSTLGTRLFFSSKRKELSGELQCCELYDNVKVWILRLPFPVRRFFQLNRAFVEEYLTRIWTEKNIRSWLVPEQLRGSITVDRDGSRSLKGNVLLKALLMPVLESIYPKVGLRIENLDMVVVAGNESEELYTVIGLLEPDIKHVTVLSEDKEQVEKRMYELFADSGLSFYVSREYRHHLKNANIVINLQNPAETARYRMPRKSLVINLHDVTDTRFPGENTIINSIVFDLPGNPIKDLMYDLRGHYGKTELYGTILAHRLELASEARFSPGLADRIQQGFKKTGARITGFQGRRGMIGINDVVKAIKPDQTA